MIALSKSKRRPQQVDAIQKVHKIDVVRALCSQVAFAVQRMKWKSLTSPKRVCAVSARTRGLAPAWHRFTQTYFCTFVILICPPTEQLAPQYQLTPCSSQFPQIVQMMCCVLDNTWTPYFQSAAFSLFQRYMVRGHLHVISDLHHYRLTSLSNHSIHWLPQYKVRRDSVSCWAHRVHTFWLIQLVVGFCWFLFSLKSYKQLTLPGPTGHPNSWTNRSYKIQNVQRSFPVKPTGGTEAEDKEHSKTWTGKLSLSH